MPTSFTGNTGRSHWLAPSHSRLATALLATCTLLAACGGNGPDVTQATATTSDVMRPSAPPLAERKRALAAPPNGIQGTLDWAEWAYPQLFPKGPASYSLTHQGVGYTVRSYAGGNNLGITADGAIWGLGPFTGEVLTSFGNVRTYAAQVKADACSVHPGTCTPPASLVARAWQDGKRFNSAGGVVVDQVGTEPRSAIDKDGRVHVLVLSSRASPAQFEVLVSTSLPGEFGAPPDHREPVLLRPATTAIPLLDGIWPTADGNASAIWTESVPCAQNPQDRCIQPWKATYDAASETWGAATPITDRERLLLKGGSNDVGDQLALVPAVGANAAITSFDLGWRQRGRSDIETLALGTGNLLADVFTATARLALDNDGRVTAVYVRVGADGASNLVARRGSIRSASLGPEEGLESRFAPVTINGFWSNPAGRVVVLWYQDNGTRVTQYASTLDGMGGNWTTTDLGARSTTDVYALGVATAGGDFHAYATNTCRALRRVGGAWTVATPLPAGLCSTSHQWALDGSGNALIVNKIDGRWASFEARSQTLYQPFVNSTPSTGTGFVLGTRWNNLPGTLLLSESGIGAFVSANAFDTLPTAASPNGDSRGPTVRNVWSLYFR